MFFHRSLDYLNEQLQQIKSSIRSVTSCGLDPLILQREYEAKSNKLAEDKTILETFDRALKEVNYHMFQYFLHVVF